ncbi:MAG: cyclic nucleotide-binding domain-containing protein [Vicinamibacterales bacterium]
MAKPLPPKRDLEDVSSFVVSAKAGDVIFEQGDASAEVYVIEDGQIELVRKDRVVRRLQAGDVFGEAALLLGGTRELTARAVTDAKVIKVDGPTFDQVINELPDVGVMMLTRLAGWVQARDTAPPPEAPRPAPEPARARPAPPKAAERPAPEPVAPEPPEPAAEHAGPPSGAPILEHAASGTVFALEDKDEFLVGRLDRAAGIMPDVDFTTVDKDKTVGRRHALIVRKGERLFVREPKATANGTFVNGSRIPPGEDVAIEAGDAVRFGFIELVFRYR